MLMIREWSQRGTKRGICISGVILYWWIISGRSGCRWTAFKWKGITTSFLASPRIALRSRFSKCGFIFYENGVIMNQIYQIRKLSQFRWRLKYIYIIKFPTWIKFPKFYPINKFKIWLVAETIWVIPIEESLSEWICKDLQPCSHLPPHYKFLKSAVTCM